MASLEGTVALVTGGAGAIGRAYCLGLAAEGASIVVADRTEPGAVAQEVEAAGGLAMAVTVDIADSESVSRMAESVLERFERIDVLVNNAAYFKEVTRGPLEHISPEEWDLCMAVNVKGTWLCSAAVVPTMKRQRSGRIVNIASNTVWKGVPGFLHYVTSKSALIGMSRAMATELGEWNILVNTVAPDFIPDDFLLRHQPGNDERVISQRALKRTSVPDDMVGMVVFLAGAGSAFITGQTFLVNGGAYYS